MWKLSAAILAGGLNSRIAVEKSLLKFGDSTLIGRNLTLLNSLFSETIIVTDKKSIRERYPQNVFCSDFYSGCGPLSGIHSALKTASEDAVFVFACDMPNLNPELINDMMSFYSQQEQCKILVPCHSRGYEPLHAIYHRDCLKTIEDHLAIKALKITSVFKILNVTEYSVPSERCNTFFNINTRDDLQLHQSTIKAESF